MTEEIKIEAEFVVFEKETIELLDKIQEKFAFKDREDMIKFFVSIGDVSIIPQFYISKELYKITGILPALSLIEDMTPETKALYDLIIDEDEKTMRSNMHKIEIHEKIEALDPKQSMILQTHLFHYNHRLNISQEDKKGIKL